MTIRLWVLYLQRLGTYVDNALIEENMKIDVVGMLSSLSKLVGQRGKATYAAANALLNA